jgi:ubiquinone/menaquinone biosynthesis C-methylase UbiE
MPPTLSRVLEPEVMDTPEEARDYDAMDHGAVNTAFCRDLRALGAIGPAVLDVGTGTALIPIELCTGALDVRVVAIDLAVHMLALAKENVVRAGLQDRITLEKVDAKAMPYPDDAFATTISNSIVHHIPEPGLVLSEIRRVTRSGGLVFIRDLARPASKADVDRLVTLYGGVAPSDPAAVPSFEHQRELFRASLEAALTVDEVTAIANAAGLEGSDIRMTSDRHWTLAFRKP